VQYNVHVNKLYELNLILMIYNNLYHLVDHGRFQDRTKYLGNKLKLKNLFFSGEHTSLQ
jgi:hypothetical protein